MKRIIFILLTLILLTGCSSNSNDGIVKTMATYLTTPNEEDTIVAESETSTHIDGETSAITKSITDTNTEEESGYIIEATTTSDAQAKSLELFEAVYVPYVSRERPCSFDSVKNFAEVNNYKFEAVEPINNEILGTIILYGESGDYVYFAFPVIDNKETSMTISFYQDSSHKEVIRNDFSDYDRPSVDIYSTNIYVNGTTQTQKVNGIDEQRKFLFN